MKLSEYRSSAARKVLVYGAPKTGKTDLVGQLAGLKKLWWFDLENGVKTLLSSPRMKKEWFDNIELIQLPDTQLNPVAVETLLRVLKGGEVRVCQAHGVVSCARCTPANAPVVLFDINKFTLEDVVVIDSVSQLAASCMNYIQRGLLLKDNFDAKPDWDDYAKQGRVMERIFSILQSAPFHVVAISHETMVEMEDGKKKLVPIGGTGPFSKTFAKYFDEVYYCEVINKKHRVASSTTYSGSIVLGSRAGLELEKETEPSLKKVFV